MTPIITKWQTDWAKCQAYAEDEFSSVKTSRKERGQRDASRIKHQCAVGKMGEILACEYLRFFGHECTEPDFEVYASFDKSWESDLFVGKQKIACKTQDDASARKYGQSWVFQRGGNGHYHTDPVMKDEESLCMFVMLDVKNCLCEVHGPYAMSDLIPLFKDPTLDALRFSKACLYWEDIRNLDAYKIKQKN
jgi:hypothetical protein